MVCYGEVKYMHSKKGMRSDNLTEWWMLRFLDMNSAQFFNAFVDEAMYLSVEKLPKGQSVILKCDLLPGRKSFQVLSIEVVSEE